MHTLLTHASCLVGLLVFMKQAWSYAPLDRAVLLAVGTGLTVYLMLVFGSALVRRIMAYTPPAAASAEESSTEEASAEGAAGEASEASSDTQSAGPAADAQRQQQQPVASPTV